MHDTDEKRAALKILAGLEHGSLPMADAAILAEDIDPVLVHAIVSFVREAYRASDPAAAGVLKRLLELTNTSPKIRRAHEEGARDPITEWFTSEYDFGEFRGRSSELIDLLVEKLES